MKTKFSALIEKRGRKRILFHPLLCEDPTDLMKHFGLHPANEGVDFFKIALSCPASEDPFKLENYRLEIDAWTWEIPRWMENNRERIEKDFKEIIQDLFIVRKQIDILTGGPYIMEGCLVGKVKHAHIWGVRQSMIKRTNNSRIEYLEGCKVDQVEDTKIEAMVNSFIRLLEGCSFIVNMGKDAHVEKATDGALIVAMMHNSTVHVLEGYAVVRNMYDEAMVYQVHEWGDAPRTVR